jgi:hypothetical protein
MAQSLAKVYIHLILSTKNRNGFCVRISDLTSTLTLEAFCEISIHLVWRLLPKPITLICYSSYPVLTRLATWSDRRNEAPRHG